MTTASRRPTSLPSLFTPGSASADEPARPSSLSIAAPAKADILAPSRSEAEWLASLPHVPVRRVPREAISHLFKGSLFGPRSWIIEPKRKHVRLDWVQIFHDAQERSRKAAADKASQPEGS